MWEALLSFRPLVTQAILFIVVPILGLHWNLGIMVTCKSLN
ncbi:hypothetical protein E2C01_024330 [Portunus trituberculatus]|uniref:Uncharacterized protein n=1 Tax=Portunus trituberculatus TaxID=210409 RepID=A0A5B7EDJ0_PORTR|nr:hypothetical protein [Portunus trituberculatus]